jgi:phosphoribosylformylglycinamidine cyclo-ligase
MKGLEAACVSQKIVVPGGEIAELPSQVKGVIWNATAVGIVEKEKFLDGSAVREGDLILGLRAAGFRSNGFSLVRYILEKNLGPDWVSVPFEAGVTWGEAVLTPSIIFHDGVLDLLGRFGQPRKAEVHGLVHVTGGGLIGNAERVVRGDLKCEFTDLWEPRPMMTRLMEMGGVSAEEAGRTWNMGTAMLVVVPESSVNVALGVLGARFEVKVVGRVVRG